MDYLVLHWHDHCFLRFNILVLWLNMDSSYWCILMGIGLAMIYDMLLHTDYTISGGKLHIRCGFLFRMDLPIFNILEITHKSTILSSPALSAKRIGLRYGKRRWVYISPKDQEEFISDLRTINPTIQISQSSSLRRI